MAKDMSAEEFIEKMLPEPKVDFSGTTTMQIGWDKFLSPKQIYASLPLDTLLTVKGGTIWKKTRFGVHNFVTGEFMTLGHFAEIYPTAQICFYDEPPCPELMKFRSVSMDAIYKEFGE
ncbi:MAG: hypothetical protein H9W81_03300 [Enterococcus sp.]|nr:hypothetical protein [Enterococcus sp.]